MNGIEGKKPILMVGRIFALLSLVAGFFGVVVGVNIINETADVRYLRWGTAPVLGIIAILFNFLGALSAVSIKSQLELDMIKLEG